ncbi:hypothetical protein N7451_006001 [Penicillium sp. IBT 35674x]|nr:hypothetical protein N7451_006001 [Penicillium sp. IBT 35674x]
MGVETVDLTKATGETSMNPFADIISASVNANADYPFPEVVFHGKKIAHGVLMVVSFVILFPFSALLLHLSSSSNIVKIHAGLQLFALVVAIVGLGLGVSMARQIHNLVHYHIIIGIVVVASLALFQPAMGLLQHRFFRKTGGKGPFAYMHRWFGRIMIILGVINVGLGYQFTGVGDPDAPRSAVIAVGVMTGIIGVVYILTVGYVNFMRRRAASAQAD